MTMRREIMSRYTAELRTIINNGFNIFDFEYTRSPDAIAIVSNEELQKGFIDRYYFNEIGFETLERFKHKLRAQWLESIEVFDKLLVAYHNEVNVKSNLGSNTKNVSIFNNTPKNALDFGEEATHATNITDNKQASSGYAGITEIELLELYHDKIKDIVSEFYDSFDNLFMQIF